MVLISSIADEIARLTGRDTATVRQISRHLREGGLLSQKGHGRGGAHATPLDAARLLIAAMVPGTLADTPKVVGHYGQLKSLNRQMGVDTVEISPEDTFEQVLAEIIEFVGRVDGANDLDTWLPEVELNISAGRAYVRESGDVIFDGPNPPSQIPSAMQTVRIDSMELLSMARMLDRP